MRREDLVARLYGSAFRPFRICLADGAQFDVPHPEFISLGDRSVAYIYEASPSGNAQAIEDYHTIVLHHITRLEPLGGVARVEG